jgi:hypothetical protein
MHSEWRSETSVTGWTTRSLHDSDPALQEGKTMTVQAHRINIQASQQSVFEALSTA